MARCDAAGHHHRPCLAADFVLGEHLLVEVIDHDFRLLADGVLVRFDVPAQLLLRLLGVELGIVLHRLGQPVVALHRRVVLEHVENETLLDGLLHRVAVERPMLDHIALRPGLAEDFQRLVLWRGGEREVAGVGQHLARFHDAVDGVLGGLFLFLAALCRQRDVHLRCRAPALAGMRLVDEDGEAPSAVLVADLVQDEGKLLHRGNDDLLAACRKLRRSPECSAWPTMAATWANCLMVSRICLSSTRRSVTTMTESNIGLLPSPVRRAGARARQWSCSCRCPPSAGSGSVARPVVLASAKSFRTTSS